MRLEQRAAIATIVGVLTAFVRRIRGIVAVLRDVCTRRFARRRGRRRSSSGSPRTEESRGPIAAVRSPATQRLPVGERAELLALLRRALEALPHPSAGREFVLEAVRRLEATAADGAADAAG
jgi:hypothetical protein